MENEKQNAAGGFPRALHRISTIWRWLLHPEEIGHPVTIPPRGVRGLALLFVGNFLILLLFATALFWTATQPLPTLPPETPIPATPTPTPTPPTPTTTPDGRSGALAFTRRVQGNVDIYALNQSDRQMIRLTYDPADDRDPAWSPDGDYLAFASNRANNWDIYLLDLVSGVLIRLTHNPHFDGHPSWSPDGTQLAFESYRDGNFEIYTLDIVGGDVERITDHASNDTTPVWAPNGEAIAFTSLRDGSKDVCAYSIEAGTVTNLTKTPDNDEDSPAWSPGGTHIAYESGPHGNPSIQVAAFNWETLEVDRDRAEVFSTGRSPAWAPDGESFVYAFEHSDRSHIVAARLDGWAQFQEVHAIDSPLDDLAWTGHALSERVLARARTDAPDEDPVLFVEVVQPTPDSGPPYELVPIPGFEGDRRLLSDRVDDSFVALRQRVIEEAGWDYLGTLDTVWLPMNHFPPNGHSRMSWHVCGRQIALDQTPYDEDEEGSRQVELVREDVGNVTTWRIYLRTTDQSGKMGEPLRHRVWDLHAREEGGRPEIEGGTLIEDIPQGYYVDLTRLAEEYGWERTASMWRWRYFWPDIQWWVFQHTDDLTWWACMLEVFETEEIERAFGPIPGGEE